MQTSVAPSSQASAALRAISSRLWKYESAFARTAAEGAELASYETDIGEIDISVDDIGDDVADEFGAKQIGRDQKAEKIISSGIRER